MQYPLVDAPTTGDRYATLEMVQARRTMEFEQRLRLWADELRTIANQGLYWSHDDPYSTARYQRVLRIAAEIFAAQDIREADAILQEYWGDQTHLAPYPGGDAAIFNTRGEILLIQRADNQLWAMPGGALEVGETPAEGTCREAWEETGLVVEPLALIGVYDSRLVGSRTRAHLYQFVFLCRPVDPDAVPGANPEALDARWYAEAGLPPLSPGHGPRIADAFRFWRGDMRETYFDK